MAPLAHEQFFSEAITENIAENINKLENTRGLGKQYHNLYVFNHLFSLNYEVKKALYKGAV